MLYKLRIQEGKSHKFRLIQIHHKQFVCRCQICLFRCKLLVEIAYVLTMFLKDGIREKKHAYTEKCLLTIFGLNGGCTSRFSILSQSIRRKNAWLLTSSSPLGPQPNRLVGFFVRNYNKL